MLHAVIAVSTIARGRVASLDVEAAKAHPGVVEVITPANRPPLSLDPDEKVGLFGFRIDALQNDRVRYAKQPIALVVAETLEAATEGARLLAPTYEVEPARVTFEDGEAYDPPAVGIGAPPNFAKGDIAAGHAAATHRVDTTYETPAQYHNAMEPHAMVAEWDGDHLTIDTPNQAIVMSRGLFAGYFGIPPENVLSAQPLPRRRLRLQGDHERPAISSPSSPPACCSGRSSWCCRATRCSDPSAIAARRSSICGSAWMPRAT